MEKKRFEEFTIGIADDHVQSAISLSNALEYEGFNTFEVYSGNDVKKSCEKYKPAMIIVDLGIDRGGLNGYQVAEAVPDQKIIFITGSPVDNKKLAKLKNIVGILKKPIDTTELIRLIKKQLKIKEED